MAALHLVCFFLTLQRATIQRSLSSSLRIAGSRDNTVRVWDVEAAQAVQVLHGHQYQVSKCKGFGEVHTLQCPDNTQTHIGLLVSMWVHAACQIINVNIFLLLMN